MSPRQSVVVAGGIGSGKSTVIAALSRLGWSVIDADRVGHEVLTDPVVTKEVARRWPAVVVGGEVSRPALGALVFADPAALGALEAITHPMIVGRIDQWIESSTGPTAIEVSALKVVRPGWGPLVLVHAPADLRLQRAIERGMNRADAEQRMDSQLSDSELLALADEVIDNQGTLAQLQLAVERLDVWTRK